jgi:hypothetical protein
LNLSIKHLFKVPTLVSLLVEQVSLRWKFKRGRLMLHVLASPGEL